VQCENVQQLVHAFVDDEVSRVVACEIEQHLESCIACQSLVHRLRRLDDILNGTAALPVPGGFASRVLGAARRRLLQDAALAKPTESPKRTLYRRLTALDAVAAAVLALGLSVGTWMASQTWPLLEGLDDLASGAMRNAQDIDDFYGADSVDSQRPLLQAYMAVVDRNSIGE
jgi:anti-sigma factor RsiW